MAAKEPGQQYQFEGYVGQNELIVEFIFTNKSITMFPLSYKYFMEEKQSDRRYTLQTHVERI